MFFAALLTLAQHLSPVPPATGRQNEPFSVLHVIADDIGQEPAGTDWSAYPSLLSTSLGQLAARGVTFTRAYSWPICCPSRFAVEYGRYPRRENVERVGLPNPVGFGNLNLNAHSSAEDRPLLELVAMRAADRRRTGDRRGDERAARLDRGPPGDDLRARGRLSGLRIR